MSSERLQPFCSGRIVNDMQLCDVIHAVALSALFNRSEILLNFVIGTLLFEGIPALHLIVYFNMTY